MCHVNYQLYYQPVGKLGRVEVANLDDVGNVKFEVEKLGQKVCKVHGNTNPTTLTTIQLQQHDDDAEEEYKIHDTRQWQHSPHFQFASYASCTLIE